MMTVDVDPDLRRKETAWWFARLNQRKVSSDDIAAFSAWRRIPGNAEAFDRLQMVWEASATLAEDPEIAALAASAKAAPDAPAKARALVAKLLTPLGAAGGLAAVLVGLAVWGVGRPTTYETVVGERRTVQLSDGSRVTLDTASRVEVRLSGDRRDIVLREGQAQFDVKRDHDRPFVVRAGETVVTALGTRFDVRRVGDGARVVLVEGRVLVRGGPAPSQAWSLAAGQQVLTATPHPGVIPADVPVATAWTSGRLVFKATPVSEAIAEVNRYSRDRIDLQAPDIGDISVSGVFDAGDTDGFVAALTDLYPLTATRAPGGSIVLTPAP